MPKIQDLTIKNTKAELFQAYQEMKERFEQARRDQLPLPQLDSLKREEARILEKTKSLLPEKLEDDIASLNKEIQLNLTEMKNDLIEESKKLYEIRKAIGIESKQLEEVYNIKLSADALQALIADFEAKKEELEKKMKSEEAVLEEEMERKKINWEREQEERQYQTKIERRKEQDEHEAQETKKRAELQEEINERLAEINEQEESVSKQLEEIENMKKEIENFPKKLETAVKETKQETEKELQKDFAIQKKIAETQWATEKKIFENRIIGLQESVKNQTSEIANLRKSLVEANQRAQNLAIAVIENTGLKQPKSESSEQSQLKQAQSNNDR